MPAIPWTTLTDAALITAKAAALVSALRSAALADSQPDPVPTIIARVIVRIRQEIAAGGRTRLDADLSKIPPSLESLALRMVLREAQSRLNAAGALPLSEDEVREEKNDLDYLKRIARGELTVELTDTPEVSATVQAPLPSPLISAPTRQWSRGNQDGI